MRVHSHALEAYSRVALPTVSAPKAPASAASTVSTPGTEAAEISVSDEARALAARASSVDETKVAELKARIEDGSYAVNTQMLAARLLDTLG
jgi:flagellar biosynthesis anti-sigma factor FlgM